MPLTGPLPFFPGITKAVEQSDNKQSRLFNKYRRRLVTTAVLNIQEASLKPASFCIRTIKKQFNRALPP